MTFSHPSNMHAYLNVAHLNEMFGRRLHQTPVFTYLEEHARTLASAGFASEQQLVLCLRAAMYEHLPGAGDLVHYLPFISKCMLPLFSLFIHGFESCHALWQSSPACHAILEANALMCRKVFKYSCLRFVWYSCAFNPPLSPEWRHVTETVAPKGHVSPFTLSLSLCLCLVGGSGFRGGE